MTVGSKVKIRSFEVPAYIGQIGVIESLAPDTGGTTVYKVRIGDMIVPGWFHDEDLEALRRPYTTLIFDLDGTLTDPAEGIMRSVEHALHRQGIEAEWQTLTAFCNADTEQAFRDIYGLEGERLSRAMEDFRERYTRRGIYERCLKPGIYGLLERLKRDGFRLAIATTGMRDTTEIVLRMLSIGKFFDLVTGREENGMLRTKADMINAVVSRLGMGTTRSSCLMIGDSRPDMEGAAQAGIDAAGVLWGYGSFEELALNGARYIVSTSDNLYALL